MARGPISGLDVKRPKYMGANNFYSTEACMQAGYKRDPNDPDKVIFTKGQWPQDPQGVTLRRKEALFKVVIQLPRWFGDLLPVTPREAILCAAAIRGSHLAKRVNWGIVTWYKDMITDYAANDPVRIVDNEYGVLHFKPDEYLQLIEYQKELCIPALPHAVLSAILVGTNIISARWGITAPSRSFPFTRREWKTLLRITNMPYSYSERIKSFISGARERREREGIGIFAYAPDNYRQGAWERNRLRKQRCGA